MSGGKGQAAWRTTRDRVECAACPAPRARTAGTIFHQTPKRVAPVVPSEGVADEPDIWRPCEGAATSTRRGAFSPGWDVAPHGAPGEGAPRT